MTTLFLLLAPLLFVSILVILDNVPRSTDDNPYNPIPAILAPKTKDLINYGRCVPFNNSTCKTIRYAFENETKVDESVIEKIFEFIFLKADLEWKDVEKYENKRQLYDFIETHPNATSSGIIFKEATMEKLSYVVLFNSTFNLVRLMAPDRTPDYRNEVCK